ncbi:hypothetical protein C493_20055 [Natronolimnohabitans innermongolicus JCM 12255]|uniref:Uncharacterized protein n=1 Tax=Natronolimnohabitans innermongolicus JCM 12255 TaxID=1227499 RepID=L9WKA3_9EURY|nr:hypothetical protein C493_20055 [Natronolimnohabitans innermongolicus JCM 12255]
MYAGRVDSRDDGSRGSTYTDRIRTSTVATSSASPWIAWLYWTLASGSIVSSAENSDGSSSSRSVSSES